MIRKAGLQFLIFILCSLCGIGSAVAASNLKVMVNNSSVEYGVVLVSGRTMVPIKVFQSFNNTVIQWDAVAKKATITRDATVIKLIAGERTASVNSKLVPLDAPVKIVEGRVTVPLRFIAEALGARVKVDAVTKTVWIQESASAAIVKNFNSSDLVISRKAALQMPLDESEPYQLTSDDEALSVTYYFPKGKSDRYFVVYGDLVRYYEINHNIKKVIWAADLDNSKDAVNKDITSLFGHPVQKEYGVKPALSDGYAYFYSSIWGSQVLYGMVHTDGTSSESGQLNDWPDTRYYFIVVIPGETKL